MTNYIVSIACAALVALPGLQANSVKVSDSQLLASLKQSLLLTTEGVASDLELSTDFEVIGSSLLPLLQFAHDNCSLQNCLVNSLTTLLVNNKKNGRASVAIKMENAQAIMRCQEEFVFFCNTTDQYDIINNCLHTIKLYYEPLASVFTTAKEQEDIAKKPLKIVAICTVSAVTLALTCYLIFQAK
jgi:hypothetical protein